MKERPYLQEDILEGTIGTTSHIRGISQDFGKNMLTDPLFRSVGMGYCDVLCFYKLYYNSVPPLRYPEYQLNNGMNDLGQFVAIIRDQEKFVNRIKIAAENQGFSFLCGSINYHPLYHNGKISEAAYRHHAVVKAERKDGKSYDLNSSPFKGKLTTKYDCFDKTDKYARQNEWRVALYRGVKDTGAYRLEIGDIRDIVSYSVINDDSSSLDNAIKSAFDQGIKEKPASRNVSDYIGNIGRDDLRKRLYELGDYQGNLIGLIGIP